MKKKLLALLFALMMFASPAMAQDITLKINGQTVQPAVAPVLEDGTTLVPIRVVSENLGAAVDWNGEDRSVTITKDASTMRLVLDQKAVSVNGQASELAVAPKSINGTTMVPIRFVSQNLDCAVEWDGDSQTVKINSNGTAPVQEPVAPANPMKVHFIDVGQANCELIQTPNNHFVMIDFGNGGDASTIKSYLNSLGVNTLDAVIATHPHEDHIGSMAAIVNAYNIGTVYMPKATHTSQTFENAVQAVLNKGLKATEAKAGVSFNVDGVQFNMYSPISSNYDDLNNWSPITMVTYGQNKILFTGDAEKLVEDEVIASGVNLKADILKVGHHGSTTSSSPAFIKAVSPAYAVIEVGADNTYGHPDNIILNRLQSYSNATIYRTDIDGTVIATCTGSSISFDKGAKQGKVTVLENTNPTPEQTKTTPTPAPAQTVQKPAISTPQYSGGHRVISDEDYVVYVTKTGTKYHEGNCSYLKKSKIQTTLGKATDGWYDACDRCNPPILDI